MHDPEFFNATHLLNLKIKRNFDLIKISQIDNVISITLRSKDFAFETEKIFPTLFKHLFDLLMLSNMPKF